MVDPYEGYDHIPEEMRWATQWCVAGPDKSPYSLSPSGLYRAKVTEPCQWLDFEDAIEAARAVGRVPYQFGPKDSPTVVELDCAIGYVIAEGDSVTCIDLDVKDKDNEPDPTKWTTQAQMNRFWAIVQAFSSYTEKSLSGKGLHIWVRGKIGKGCRRDGVEVYSQERFIICSGNVVNPVPIQERQGLLDILVKEMQSGQANETTELVEVEAIDTDQVVWERASKAANNDKFLPLCEGRWVDLGYPSQSEADLSLMSMFCFYSKSNSQCMRLFRMTGLGRREKAVKDDRYLNYTLSRIRGRQAKEEIAQLDARAQAERLAQRLMSQPKPKVLPVASAVQMASIGRIPDAPDGGVDWPPGFAGHLAGFIYNSSTRPVKEVSIVTALGILAGICGKAFNIPQSGLNMYIILVAQSAIGKEAMLAGPAKLFTAVRERLPQAMNFVNFTDFASGPGLIKAVAENPSFVNISGEWGKKLKLMADDKSTGPMSSMRKVMTDLYQKSGHSSIVGGISYSDKEKNIASVGSVAYSMMGDTTPGSLYETLNESMMEDGFLSRFITVEYKGQRPPHNANAVDKPNQALSDGIGQLCHQALSLIHRNAVQMVVRDDEAALFLHQFDLECDERINSTMDEAYRQMWNRAALKTMRLAALLAVADNFANPIINIGHARWSLDLVKRDIANMQRKLTSGDVGQDDYSRERKVLSILEDAIRNGAPKGVGVPIKMIQDGVIPKKFLAHRTTRVAAFCTHRLGATAALNMTINSLIDTGDLVEVPKDRLVREYAYHGKCYQLLSVE